MSCMNELKGTKEEQTKLEINKISFIYSDDIPRNRKEPNQGFPSTVSTGLYTKILNADPHIS